MPYAWVYPTPFTGYLSKFYAYQNVVQSIPNNVLTVLDFNAELFDILNEFNLVTNRFIPVANGYYLLSASVKFTIIPDQKTFGIYLRKNGVTYLVEQYECNSGVNDETVDCVILAYLLTTDYVEALIWHNFGAAKNTSATVTVTYFFGHRLS